jgi:hypothetical protein
MNSLELGGFALSMGVAAALSSGLRWGAAADRRGGRDAAGRSVND